MTPTDALEGAILPALAMLPKSMGFDAAQVMLLAIGLQESRLQFRRQMGNGPARGLWQFEKGGGVRGVLRHPATEKLAAAICLELGVVAQEWAVWHALETDDILAAVFARLLLWTDPDPLPTTAAAGWDLYARTWRPGKPHPERWPDNYQQAQAAVMG